MTARLALAGVACVRGGRTLFDGLDLTLAAGGAAVVTGPNGIGKSSLLRIVAGLLAPAAGSVAREGRLALLGEAPALDPERTLADALGLWAAIDGNRGGVDEALAAVGLGDAAGVPVRWLSTGQRRRAGLARVLASRAEVWLLDEPANGLDLASVAVLETLIADHRARGGIAVIASHLPLAVAGAPTVALGARA